MRFRPFMNLLLSFITVFTLSACSSTTTPPSPEPDGGRGFTFHFDPATGFHSNAAAEAELSAQALLSPGIHLKLARLQSKRLSSSQMQLTLAFKNISSSPIDTLVFEALVASGNVTITDPTQEAIDQGGNGSLEPNELTNDLTFTITSPDNFTTAFSLSLFANDSALLSVSGQVFTAVRETVTVDNTLYFVAQTSAYGRELWKSDGSEAGTVLVKDINPGSSDAFGTFSTKFAVLNGIVYFVADDGTYGNELWRTDGTTVGTSMVKDIYPGVESAMDTFDFSIIVMNDHLYFNAYDPTHGPELWMSDGSEAGTILLKDINPGSNGSGPFELTADVRSFYFGAFHPLYGEELWKSDGTEGGTVLVKDVLPGPQSSIFASTCYCTLIDGILYYVAGDSTVFAELFKSDGTAEGTVLVKDIYPGLPDAEISRITAFNGQPYFGADHPTYGFELWTSDGTEAGTVLVKDINPGSGSSSLSSGRIVFNNNLYFSASGPQGRELWKSDGTDAGTVVVKDIRLGSGASSPTSLTSVINTLYFTANDGVNGVELWQSDGSTSGTVMVQDLNLGSAGSSPIRLTNVNGILYFFADDGTGIKLWKVL
jgi:ELWxxDGT repeat protein